MKNATYRKMRIVALAALLSLSGTLVFSCAAGQAKKWDEVPEAVRAAILANGGVAGQAVDKEPNKINGKAVYEAPVKGKNGRVLDLVLTEDGKLVATKDDDAADRAKELADQAAKSAPKIAAGPKFSHPREITNPYLPLAYLKQDILEGKEGSATVRMERTAKPSLHKTFKIGDQKVETLAVEDRAYENGELHEVAMDYFAQDDAGIVYYLGEDVDEYEKGKVVSHAGAWLYGVNTKQLGVLIPAHPKVGDKFKSEDVSDTIREEDEVVSVSETVTVPAGTYADCVKVKEKLADGKIEYKYYAPGVGVVMEVPDDGKVVLKTHKTKK